MKLIIAILILVGIGYFAYKITEWSGIGEAFEELQKQAQERKNKNKNKTQ